ncbi:MAG: Ig-like domain-containing protein [Muribaculaceae bacterium]|nr:Ig-like domain-containing protein [Muribaculaceae bacterium]MDE6632384.1 Ig-like domain-containing protein [Muribaculaceae bacterium]
MAAAAASILLLWGCASIGNPSGGARDEDPPRFVRANPAPGSVNVDPSNINIDFNELVNVKEAFQKVVLSPPGKSTPRVSTRGRRVVVNITDTLLPNTTYTIDFGDAIEDNNEGNKLSGFAYTFSTGPVLDSLRISGMVLGAEDMEPQQGVFVGAYISKEDSAFIRMPFERLSRTDEYGRFIIRGLQDTTYRLFALKDLDNDRHYANPEEDIAWFEDIIRPTSERIMTNDTIRNLYNGAIDTIVQRERTRFLPNNILLRMYNTGLKPQYLVSYTRPDSTQLEFIFNSPSKKQPQIMIADDEAYSYPLRGETTVGNDTLKFWLPQDLAVRDTLKLALRYQNIDLLTGVETMVNDTVKLMKPKEQSSKKKDQKKKKPAAKEKDKEDTENPADSIDVEKPVIPTFAFTAKGPESDIARPLAIEVPVPLSRLDSLAFFLEMKSDTVWVPVKGDYRLERADTLSERRFKIEFPWQRGSSYRLSIDSLAATDIYGINSAPLQYEFKTKAPEDLSNLKITLVGLEPQIPAFVQLMASGDKPKYTAPVVNGAAYFEGIDAGKYYARLYEDFNGDGKFTPGSYRLQRFFGEPADSIMAKDTIMVADAESPVIPGDSIDLANESMVIIGDSIAVAVNDSIGLQLDSIPKKAGVSTVAASNTFIRPMGDRQIVDSLLRIGYSISPLESDSVGKEILIAIQPDYVYYYPKTINVKKNWDMEQTWNVFETALDLQKPAKIKKNKPKRNNNSRNQEEEEEEDDDEFGANPFDSNRRNNNRNNSNNRGNNRNSGLREAF